jgi:hypothetical protein
MISERVLPSAVRYRGSASTSPTFTVLFFAIALLVNPLVMGKVGYSGGPGPSQTRFLTSSLLVSPDQDTFAQPNTLLRWVLPAFARTALMG